MNLNEYQTRALASAIYPSKGQGNPVYPMLGLAGEVGEVSEHIKKALRDDGGKITPDRKAKLLKETGDVMWYLAAFAHELGFTLEEVAQANLEKLADRKERGVLQGSGSDR